VCTGLPWPKGRKTGENVESILLHRKKRNELEKLFGRRASASDQSKLRISTIRHHHVERADDVRCHVSAGAVCSVSSSSREAGKTAAAAADAARSTAPVMIVYRGLYGAARSRGDLCRCRPTSGDTLVLLGR